MGRLFHHHKAKSKEQRANEKTSASSVCSMNERRTRPRANKKTSASVCSMNERRTRPRGTGSIYPSRWGTYTAQFRHKYVGSFKTRQQADLALEQCMKSGKALRTNIRMRPSGTGCISQHKHHGTYV